MLEMGWEWVFTKFAIQFIVVYFNASFDLVLDPIQFVMQIF
jgi:hypothetical protein